MSIDIPNRKIDLEVSEEKLSKRRKAWKPKDKETTGYLREYKQGAVSADRGASIDTGDLYEIRESIKTTRNFLQKGEVLQ